MPLDMDLIRDLGHQRATARKLADEALTTAYDLIQHAYEHGDRVNIKQAAELLGLTRQQIYTELNRRGVKRLRAT